jgi:hypothetical protein
MPNLDAILNMYNHLKFEYTKCHYELSPTFKLQTTNGLDEW